GQLGLELLRVLRERVRRPGVGLLDPGDLHLCPGDAGLLQLLVHAGPVAGAPAVVVGVLRDRRGLAALGPVDEYKPRVLVRIARQRPLETQGRLDRVTHADRHHHDLAVGAGFAVGIEALHPTGQGQPGGLVGGRPDVAAAGVEATFRALVLAG